MKSIQWAQFAWDLSKTAPGRPALPPSFSIRRATGADEEAVRTLVMSAFKLDSEWNAFFFLARPLVETALEQLFENRAEPLCLVINHGPRIIGVSGLSAEKDASSNLLTGPCLAMEYHNRGLGTHLLAHSLTLLHESGLNTARGVTKEGTTAAQFLYPKFGATRLAPSASLTEELDKQVAQKA